jgi:trimethylamine--corrinoid protein Co-methyltransferase
MTSAIMKKSSCQSFKFFKKRGAFMSIQGLKSAYYKNKTNYSVATEAECEKIIAGAFHVMAHTGLEVKHEGAVKRLVDAGCKVEGERVWIPSELVIKAINSAAREMVLYDRMGNVAIHAGGINNYYGNGPTNPFYNDFETGERRECLKKDVANNVRVSDACPNIDFIMGLAGISDCNPNIADVAEMHEAFPNTTKPIVSWAVDLHGVKDIFEMCAAIAGSWENFVEKPFMAMFPGCPVTPLIIPGNEYEKMEYCVQQGVPVIIPTGAQLGAVSPTTIAGGVVLGLAEVLTFLVLSQLIKKGSVCALGIVVLTVDMSTTQSAYGSPEHCLAESLVADIFHYLDLPMFQTGGVTESKLPDEQSAIESSMQIISNALSGGHMVHDVGFIDSAMSTSLDQVVMCDEIIGYARRIARGVEINDETLALDVINEVGPGGEFLTHKHTFTHFKKEFWTPRLLDRSRYQNWIKNPKDMRQRVHQRTKEILENHKAPALSQEVMAKLDVIWERAQKRG